MMIMMIMTGAHALVVVAAVVVGVNVYSLSCH